MCSSAVHVQCKYNNCSRVHYLGVEYMYMYIYIYNHVALKLIYQTAMPLHVIVMLGGLAFSKSIQLTLQVS